MKFTPCFIRRTLLIFISALALALTGGCASYHLGSPVELDFESIYIRPAENQSYAPQAQALISAQVRQAFIHDGRVTVVSAPAQADAILELSLTNYERRAAARQSNDSASASSFDLQLEAELSLYDQNRGRYYFRHSKLSEHSSTYVGNPYANPAALNTEGYLASESDAMPRLARSIARKVTDAVLSPWPAPNSQAEQQD
ncbi:MAG: hypothetical protein ACI81V_001028 [Lentimonas sp.]|jgi:hypothetical protein